MPGKTVTGLFYDTEQTELQQRKASSLRETPHVGQNRVLHRELTADHTVTNRNLAG